MWLIIIIFLCYTSHCTAWYSQELYSLRARWHSPSINIASRSERLEHMCLCDRPFTLIKFWVLGVHTRRNPPHAPWHSNHNASAWDTIVKHKRAMFITYIALSISRNSLVDECWVNQRRLATWLRAAFKILTWVHMEVNQSSQAKAVFMTIYKNKNLGS